MNFKVTRQEPFEGLIGAFANTTDPNRPKYILNIEKSDCPKMDFQNAFSMPLRSSKNRNQEWAKTHLEFDGEHDFMRYCLFLFAREYFKLTSDQLPISYIQIRFSCNLNIGDTHSM